MCQLGCGCVVVLGWSTVVQLAWFVFQNPEAFQTIHLCWHLDWHLGDTSREWQLDPLWAPLLHKPTILLLLANDRDGQLYHMKTTEFGSCRPELLCASWLCPSSTGSDGNINEGYFPFAEQSPSCFAPLFSPRSYSNLHNEVLIVFGGLFLPVIAGYRAAGSQTVTGLGADCQAGAFQAQSFVLPFPPARGLLFRDKQAVPSHLKG